MSGIDRLVELIDQFHITDRALLRARQQLRKRNDDSAFADLARAAQRYFGAMEREARKQLGDIDHRLDDLYQRQYNLQAERGVIERRRAGARRVLEAIDSCGGAGVGRAQGQHAPVLPQKSTAPQKGEP